MNYTSAMQIKTNGHSLPKGWRWSKLSDVCNIIMGQSPPGNTYKQTPDGLPFFQGKADFGSRHPVARVWCTEPTRIAKPGDILLSVRAPVGPTNVADVKCCIGRGLAAIQPKEQADKEFVLLALKYREDILVDLGSGSTFEAIRKVDLFNLEIPLPPLNEQRRIASRLNDQLAAVQSARKAAEEQLHAGYKLPSAYLRDVFESKEAKHWQSKFIGDLAETCSGSTPLRSRSDYYIDGTIPWVKTGELKDGIIDDTEEHITELALKESSLKLLPEKTLLIAMYGQGQTRGRTTIIAKPMTVNQACFAIMPNESFDTEFLQFWFRNSYERLRKETEGRGGNQPNLNGQVLNKQRAVLPPIDEQNLIVKSLKEKMQQSELVIDKLESQLAEIESLPASLLREAFAGQG